MSQYTNEPMPKVLQDDRVLNLWYEIEEAQAHIKRCKAEIHKLQESCHHKFCVSIERSEHGIVKRDKCKFCGKLGCSI